MSWTMTGGNGIFDETAMGDAEPSKIKSPEVMLNLFVSASSSL